MQKRGLMIMTSIPAIILIGALAFLVFPFSTAAASPTYTNVQYCSNGAKADFYLPGTTGLHPVVIAIHGGGWTGGSKTTSYLTEEFPALLAAGFVVVAPNYQLAPNHTYPAPEQNVHCLIQYLQANSAKYGIDMNQIGCFGESAGGQICDMSYFLYPGDGIKAIADWYSPSNLTISSDFNTTGNSNIAAEFGASFADKATGSPITYAATAAIPFLFYHGLNDTSINYLQSVRMCNALPSGLCTLNLVNNAGHSWAHALSWPPMTPSLKNIEQGTANWFAAAL